MCICFEKESLQIEVKGLEMRSTWVIWVGPKSNDLCPFKRQAHRGEGTVKMEADAAVGLGGEAQECQDSHQKLGEVGDTFFPRAQVEYGPGDTWISDF